MLVLGITTKTRRSTVCLLKKLPRFPRLIAARFESLRFRPISRPSSSGELAGERGKEVLSIESIPFEPFQTSPEVN